MHPSHESEVFGFNYPKIILSIIPLSRRNRPSKGALPGGFKNKTQNSTRITMQTAILCLCKEVSKM